MFYNPPVGINIYIDYFKDSLNFKAKLAESTGFHSYPAHKCRGSFHQCPELKEWSCYTPLKLHCPVMSIVLLLPQWHMFRILKDMAFYDWLLALSDVSLRLFYVFSWFDSHLLE